MKNKAHKELLAKMVHENKSIYMDRVGNCTYLNVEYIDKKLMVVYTRDNSPHHIPVDIISFVDMYGLVK